MASEQAVSVVERIHVSPPPTTPPEMSLPFTLFDTFWVHLSNVNRLSFFNFPVSETTFVDSLIPKLTSSLSLALNHFYMLAGNLIIPSNDSTSTPVIRYVRGDSVSLVFARADSIDFDSMVGNGARACRDFYPLVPQIEPEPPRPSSNSTVVPLLALQVTLFPNVGISIGVTNHHAVGDANTIFRFVRAWSLFSKRGGGSALDLPDELLPLYDRTVIEDPKGLAKILWSQISGLKFQESFSNKLLNGSTDKVRGTFVIDRDDVQRLKNFASSNNPSLVRLSTFVVVCAYVWTCIVKSRVAIEENVDEDELEHFGFVADSRARLNPPVPDNYFGNCLVFSLSTAKVKELIGERGFVLAVELVVESMNQRLRHKDGVLRDAENWFTGMGKVNLKRVVGVAGSPRYNYYDLDFGLGKAKKFEFVSIDSQGSIALSGSKESEKDIEVGLSFNKERMDAFTACFNEGLRGI